MSDRTTVTIKAYDGDRSKNLDGIAKSIDDILSEYCRQFPQTFSKHSVGRLRGYAEQLRIIAKEIKKG